MPDRRPGSPVPGEYSDMAPAYRDSRHELPPSRKFYMACPFFEVLPLRRSMGLGLEVPAITLPALC